MNLVTNLIIINEQNIHAYRKAYYQYYFLSDTVLFFPKQE